MLTRRMKTVIVIAVVIIVVVVAVVVRCKEMRSWLAKLLMRYSLIC